MTAIDFNSTNITERKSRDFKGTSVGKHVDDYCVLDLETTGVFINSADIIEISALKVRDNQVVGEYSTLINPECHIPEQATRVNHITDAMVKEAPTLDMVIDDFLDFVGDDVIVGYNNAGFDMNLIYDSVYRLRNVYFRNDYLDILYAVRRSLPELKNAKLETASEHYGLDTTGEHRALKDCYLTKDCYDKLYQEFGDKAFKSGHFQSQSTKTQFTSETILLQQLQKLLVGILKDGQVTEDEVDTLRFWIEEHRDLAGNYPFDRVFNALDDVLEDGIITAEELSELRTVFDEVIDPVKYLGCHDQISTLVDKHICLTGDFDYGARSVVVEFIQSVGGIIDKSVKRDTDYVVVGTQGSDAWKTGHYGTKIQKAIELADKGYNIKIYEEKIFLPALQYLKDHSEECETIE